MRRDLDTFIERLDAVIEFGGPGARAFFDDRNGFAARTFHTLGREQDRRDAGEKIAETDLVAVSLLDVRLRPSAVRHLLLKEGEDIARDIAAIQEEDIWEVADWSREAESVKVV